MRIFNKENHMLVHEIEGGAAIPGWTNPEVCFEITHLL